MRNFVVVGAGFGDEGKGMTTLKLQQCFTPTIMFRHNGGAQAGHTVKHNGSRVVNQSLNSATVNGQHFTAYTKDVVVNINAITNEAKQHGNSPWVGMTGDNEWTTYLDIAFNQIVSKSQGSNGTCGFGINATLRRAEHISFTFKNAVYGMDALKKIYEIRDFYVAKFIELGIPLDLYKDYISADAMRWHVRKMLAASNFMYDNGCPITEAYDWADEIKEEDRIIFEGAQGLLLDQTYGEFPFVTPSNTGLVNAATFMRDVDNYSGITPVYCTRTFLTRHGDGPFIEEQPFVDGVSINDETNITNQFQGRFKTGILDVDKMKAVIKADLKAAKAIYSSVNTPIMSVSHLDIFDQTKVKIKVGGEVIEVGHDEFINAMPYPVKIMGYGVDSQQWVSIIGD